MVKLHTPGSRLYKSSRGPVPRVTDILKTVENPYVQKWRNALGAEADEKSRAAQTFGTKLHAAAVLVAQNYMDVVEPTMIPYAKAVADFLSMHVAECLKMELELVSEQYLFGGRLDLYCRMYDGAYAVIDWKTTGGLTREHGLQVAAYALLLRENGMQVNRRIVVRIKKEAPGKFYARTYADHKGDVEAFLALNTYYHWAHKRKLEAAA